MTTIPPVKEPPDEDKDGKRIQGGSPIRHRACSTPAGRLSLIAEGLRDFLKTRITEAKRRNDLPVDLALGSPSWEQSVADGRLDQPEEDDDK